MANSSYQELRAELVDLVDANADPVLTNDQVDRAMRRGRVPDIYGYPPDEYLNWAAATVYPAGARIVPVERDGYYYITDAGGTSGASEPDFEPGQVMIDNTVTWRYGGVAPWSGLYNLDRSAAYAWRLKQGIAAKRKNVAALGQATNSSEVFEHCKEMAEYYAGRITGSVRLSGANRRAIY